jgi:hypothetical protein
VRAEVSEANTAGSSDDNGGGWRAGERGRGDPNLTLPQAVGGLPKFGTDALADVQCMSTARGWSAVKRTSTGKRNSNTLTKIRMLATRLYQRARWAQ